MGRQWLLACMLLSTAMSVTAYSTGALAAARAAKSQPGPGAGNLYYYIHVWGVGGESFLDACLNMREHDSGILHKA